MIYGTVVALLPKNIKVRLAPPSKGLVRVPLSFLRSLGSGESHPDIFKSKIAPPSKHDVTRGTLDKRDINPGLKIKWKGIGGIISYGIVARVMRAKVAVQETSPGNKIWSVPIASVELPTLQESSLDIFKLKAIPGLLNKGDIKPGLKVNWKGKDGRIKYGTVIKHMKINTRVQEMSPGGLATGMTWTISPSLLRV